MSTERRSLAEAFKPQPARGSSLEGLLAPKRRKPAAPPAEATETPAPDTTPVAEPPIRPAKNTGGAAATGQDAPQRRAAATPEPVRKPASQTVPGAPRNVGVYLPPELLAEVKQRTRSEQITYSDLLVDAFEALDPAAISAEFSLPAVPVSSTMPRRVRRPRGTAGIQIQLRLDDRQIQWLDEQTLKHGAPSRSALVSTAFRLYTSH